MDRNAEWLDRDCDTLVFVTTGPEPEADIYDYPGAYAQRFDGIDPGTSEVEVELAIHAWPEAGMDYANSFDCISDG